MICRHPFSLGKGWGLGPLPATPRRTNLLHVLQNKNSSIHIRDEGILRGTTRITSACVYLPTCKRHSIAVTGFSRHRLLGFIDEVPFGLPQGNRRVQPCHSLPRRDACFRWHIEGLPPCFPFSLTDGLLLRLGLVFLFGCQISLLELFVQVDPGGFEPPTFSMPLRRAPNCAMGPGFSVFSIQLNSDG